MNRDDRVSQLTHAAALEEIGAQLVTAYKTLGAEIEKLAALRSQLIMNEAPTQLTGRE